MRLTRTETAILRALQAHGEGPVSVPEITRAVWGTRYIAADGNVVRVHIQNIRRKLGAEAIETVRFCGYRLAREVAA